MSQVVHAIPLPGPRRLEGRFVHVPHSPGFMLKACRTACAAAEQILAKNHLRYKIESITWG